MISDEFLKLDKRVDSLLEEGKGKEALQEMINGLDRFEEDVHMIYGMILFYYRSLQDWDSCVHWFKKAFNKGYFYGLSWPGWDGFRTHNSYKEIESYTGRLKSEADKTSSFKSKIVLPENYDINKKYPLMIILHGDGLGCNIDYFSRFWACRELQKQGWITAYFQSPVHYCTEGFAWTSDYPKARQNITRGIDHIKNEYSINEEHIVLGGYSGGSMAALNYICHMPLPVKGLVLLCPDIVDDFSSVNLEKASQMGTKLYMMEGSKSDKTSMQTIFDILHDSGISFKEVINPGIGHQIPEDIESKTIEALDFIFDE